MPSARDSSGFEVGQLDVTTNRSPAAVNDRSRDFHLTCNVRYQVTAPHNGVACRTLNSHPLEDQQNIDTRRARRAATRKAVLKAGRA